MKVQGKITAITEAQTGTGKKGEWAKRTIVVTEETGGQYPNEFVLTLFKSGEHIEYATTKFNYVVGNSVSVEYNVRANEYQGKWYGDNFIWKIEKIGITETQEQGHIGEGMEPDDLPF